MPAFTPNTGVPVGLRPPFGRPNLPQPAAPPAKLVQYRSYGGYQGASPQTWTSVSLPNAPVYGNLLVIVSTLSYTGQITPTGWTQVSNGATYVFAKVSTGASDQTVTLSYGSSGFIYMELSGVTLTGATTFNNTPPNSLTAPAGSVVISTVDYHDAAAGGGGQPPYPSAYTPDGMLSLHKGSFYVVGVDTDDAFVSTTGIAFPDVSTTYYTGIGATASVASSGAWSTPPLYYGMITAFPAGTNTLPAPPFVPQVKLKRTQLPMRPRSLRRFTPPITPPSPTIRGSASVAQTAGSTGATLTINASSLSTAPVPGDRLFGFVNYNNQDNTGGPQFNFTQPTGWTNTFFQQGISTLDWLAVFERTATGSQEDNFVLQYAGDPGGTSMDIVGTVIAVQNAGTASYSAPTSTNFATTATVSSVGNTADLLLVNAGIWVPSSWGAAPTGMTAVTSASSAGTTPEGGILYQQNQITPASKTVSVVSGGRIMALAIAIPYKIQTFTPAYPPVNKTSRRSALPAHLRARKISNPRPPATAPKFVPQVRTKRPVPPVKARGLRSSTPVSVASSGLSASIRGFATGFAGGNPTGTITINASSLSPSAPAAGDVMLAFVNYNNANNNTTPSFGPTTPTGWTIASPVTSDGGNNWIVVYKRTAISSTADNFVFNFQGDTSGGEAEATAIIVSLQNAGTPVFTTPAQSGGVGNRTLTAASTGSVGDLLLVNAGNYPWSTAGSVGYSTAPAGMTTVATVANIESVAPESSVLYKQTLGTPGTRTVTTLLDASMMGISVSVPYSAGAASSSFVPQTKISRKAFPLKGRSLRSATPVTTTAATVAPTFVPQSARIRVTPPRTTRRIIVAIPAIPAPTYVPIPNRLRYARPKPSPTRTRVSSPVQTAVVATPPTFIPQAQTKRPVAPVKARALRVAGLVPTPAVATAPTYVSSNKVKRVISPFKPRSLRVASPVPTTVVSTPPTFISQTKAKRPAAPMRTRPTRVFSPVFPAAVVAASSFIPQVKIKRASVPARPRSLRVVVPFVSPKAFVPTPTRLRTSRPRPFIRRGTVTPIIGQILTVSVTDNAGVFESRTNLAPNPSGETNTSGWTWQAQSSGDAATVSQNATSPLYGSQVIRALITAPQTATSNHGMQVGSSGTVSAGDTITASVWIRPSRTNVFKFGLDFTGGGNSATSVAVSCPAGVWTQISATGVAAAGTTGVVGNLWTNSAGGSVFWQTNDTIDFDGLLIEKSATVGSFVETTVPSVTYSFVKVSTSTDLAGTSDAASTLVVTGAPVTDTAGVSDSVSISISSAGVITDTSGTSDVAIASLIKGATLSDRTTMYDKVTTVLSHTKSVTVTDQSGVTDTPYAYLINRPHGSWGAQINRSHG